MDDECGLYAVSLGNEDEVVARPQGQKDTSEVPYGEVVLRPVFVDNDGFQSQGTTHPLAVDQRSVSESLRESQRVSETPENMDLRCTLRSVRLRLSRFQ